MVTSTMETVQATGGANAWSTPISFTLNLTDSKTIYGTTVTYADIGNQNTIILFRIVGGTATDAALGKSQSACIKGTCINTPNETTPQNVGDIRLTVTDIKLLTTSSANTSGGSGEPIDVYLKPDSSNRINVPKDDASATFDIIQYNQKSGWSSSTSQKSLNLYIHRNYGEISIMSVETDGIYDDFQPVQGEDTMYYVLKSNTKYTFKIKSTTTGTWSTEKTNTYTITIKGLAESTSSSKTAPLPTAPYDVVVGVIKTMPMSENGKFDTLGGVTISSQTANTHDLTFSQPGTYTLIYKTDSGTTQQVVFNAASKQDGVAPVATVKANQVQPTVGGFDTNMILIILGAVIVIVIFYMKKKKGGGGNHIQSGNRIG
ncbi:MAG: hypothetical protein WC623_22245 [Pedobacter sp.]|uniref:hypothetical protein n=1 Tax=Pedobacter sp. TaxID=1411316 RepID=UPI003564D2F7